MGKIREYVIRKFFNMHQLKYLAQPIGYDFWRDYCNQKMYQPMLDYAFPIIKTAIAYNDFFSKIITSVEEFAVIEVPNETINNRTKQYVYVAETIMGVKLEIRFELVDFGPSIPVVHNGYVKIQFKAITKKDIIHLGTFYVIHYEENMLRYGVRGILSGVMPFASSSEESVMVNVMKKLYNLISTRHLSSTYNMIYVKGSNAVDVESVECIETCTNHTETIGGIRYIK